MNIRFIKNDIETTLEMNREQEFARQLERDSNRIGRELLNNPEWEWLRNFYETHFDKISNLLRYGNLMKLLDNIE